LKTLVDDQYSGQTGPCAGCGKDVTMPTGRSPLKNSLSPALPTQGGIRSAANTVALLKRIGVAAGLFFLSGLVIWLAIVPAVQRAVRSRNQAACLANLKQIATALDAYAQKHGTYPTPVVYDSKGTPLYSWRVLILPELGYKDLYDGFQKDQAWNSPTNLNLMSTMPEVYASPASPDARALHQTNYALLTGPGTLFPPTGPLSPKAIQDKPSQTLLVVETTNSGQSWTAPNDIDVSRGLRLGTRSFADIGGNHPDGAMAVTVDLTPIFLPNSLVNFVLDALVSPDGGEAINIEDLVR
jgi:hypothetical protein